MLTKYGDNNFGQGLLLARRLVENGIRYVEVSNGGWDTHDNNFDRAFNTDNVIHGYIDRNFIYIKPRRLTGGCSCNQCASQWGDSTPPSEEQS